MTLIVEDGTGVTGADSYVSSANTDAYAAIVPAGAQWLTVGTTSVKEDALRQAARYLDGTYATQARLAGRKQYPTQGLAWPRLYCFDRDGYAVNSNFIHPLWIVAQQELAFRAIEYSLLSPDIDRGGFTSSERVGPIAVTYQPNAPPFRRYAYIDVILAPILSPMTRLYRA